LNLTKPAKKYLVIIGFLVCVFNPSVVQADEETNFRVGLVNNNQVFSNPAEATSGGVIRLSVSNGRDATVKVELVDIFANSQGAKQSVPLNSTPFSPANLVSYEVLQPNYQPNGEKQFIDISYSFIDAENINRPVIGGLKISLDELNEEFGEPEGLTLNSSIVATFSYYPIGSTSGDFELDALLNIRGIDLASIRQEPLIYSLMPDIPRLFNDGPIRADVSVINNGNIFLQTNTEISVDQLKIFSGFRREELFRDTLDEFLLVPGQAGSGQKLLVNEIVGSERVVDALAGIGIFQIQVKTIGAIGGDVLTQTNEAVWFVIFPWKPFFLILLVFILILMAQKRRLNKSSIDTELMLISENDTKILNEWLAKDLDKVISRAKIKPIKSVTRKSLPKKTTSKKKLVTAKKRPTAKKPVANKRIAKKPPAARKSTVKKRIAKKAVKKKVKARV
jgi:hypothetical protein